VRNRDQRLQDMWCFNSKKERQYGEELDFRGKYLPAEQAPDLLQFLKDHPQIIKLNLTGIKIEDDSNAILIAIELIKHNTTLQELNLGNNALCDFGIIEIMRAFARSNNTTLKKLDLSFNGIGDEGACIIATTIAKIPTLKILNLWGNKITDAGVIELAANTTLNVLNLGDNEFSDAGVIALAANTRRAVLNLFHINFGELGMQALLSNTTLTDVLMWNLPNKHPLLKNHIEKNKYNKLIPSSLNAFLFAKSWKEDSGVIFKTLPLEIVYMICGLVHELNGRPTVTVTFFLESIPLIIQQCSDVRLLKEEAIQLDVFRENPIYLETKHIALMDELLRLVADFKKQINDSNANIFIKCEIESLHQYLLTIPSDKTHISAYKLALMINALAVAEDNLYRLHDIKEVAEKIRRIMKSIITDCEMQPNNFLTVQSNYPSNYNSAIIADTVKLNLLTLLINIDHCNFWSQRGDPVQIKKMLIVLNDKTIKNEYDKWEKIKECARYTAWFDKPHKDTMELCQAILNDDVETLQAFRNKVNEQTLQVMPNAKFKLF